MCTVIYSIYVDCSRSAVGHTCAIWQAYLLGAYSSNVKCMYTGAPGHIIDCSGFISGITLT